MSRLGVAALGLAVAVAGAGWLLMRPVDRGPVPLQPVPAELVDSDKLQKLATESCLCDRSGGGSHDACWAQYRTAIADWRVTSVASACEPLSSELECIETTAGERCILVGFGSSGLCTEEEAAAAEQAFAAAPEGEEFSAMDAVVERIKRGETVSAESGRGGCVSPVSGEHP